MAWRPAPLPADEPQRRAALRDLGWFALPADGLSRDAPVDAMRSLADAARHLCGCPVGAVTLVDAEHGCQVGVDGTGSAPDAAGDVQPRLHVAPRAQLICAHVVAANDYLEVPDILRDPRFAGAIDHPASQGWRFYAAMPLRLQGHAVGTLSVAAPQPRTLDATQRRQLAQLAQVAEALLAARHASEALARERQRLADLARASGDWLWELDERLCHRWLSDDAERLTGLPPASLIGRPLDDELCVDALGDPLPSGASLRSRLAEGVPLTRVVTRLDTPRRGRLFVSRSAVPVLDAQGRVVGWRGSACDVTSQVLAARETRERDQRMHKLLSQVPGAAFQLRLDAQGTRPHYLFANEGLRGLIGDADGPGLPTLRHVWPEDRARVADAILAATTCVEPLRIEYRLQPGDGGSLRWLETRATPERQPDGSVVFHGFTWDVTERHLGQAALKEHDVLRLAREAAERASRAKSEFLSRVSHELRTPLNAILGFAQLMELDREQPLSGTQRQRLDGVRQAGQALLALVDDVLDVSRLEQGTIALRSQPVALSGVIRRAADAVQPLAVARAVRLTLDDPSGCWVQADAGALEHVLVNLLSNAIKFNRAGGRVQVEAELSDEATVTIHVQDDGEGLRPDQISQLFQPFNRLGAQRRRISGSGLGLVITRGLARAMGGDVLVHSEPGRGSRFSVCLPTAAAVAGDDGAPGEAAQPAGGVAADTPGRVVLYIEDEPLNVLLIEEVFRTQLGWTLHVAHDGRSGVELAARLRPDLALIDMNLPDMNGLEVLRRLRADPTTADLLCVALSADAMSEQIAAARAAGFDDYWTKPIDLTRLLDSVRRVIDERGGRAG
jgi:signal transduction histidine kinase/CheY-like chemotaxis protein